MQRTTRTSPSLRMLGATVVVAASLGLSGCGFDAQTLQSYPPAHGVNVDQGTLKVRNVLIIANDQGSGRLSASLVSQEEPDTLQSASGVALRVDGTEGGPLTVSGGPVTLDAGKLVTLTGDGAPEVRVTGADLKPGLTARLNLTFGSGASSTLTVPVVSASDPIYASAAPGLATAAPTSAGPSPTASPTGESHG